MLNASVFDVQEKKLTVNRREKEKKSKKKPTGVLHVALEFWKNILEGHVENHSYHLNQYCDILKKNLPIQE